MDWTEQFVADLNRQQHQRMVRRVWTVIGVTVAVIVCGWLALRMLEPPPPDPAPLIAALQPIQHTDPGIFAVDVRGQYVMIEQGIAMKFVLLVPGPRQVAAYLLDAADDTPLMACVDEQTLIYDQASGTLAFMPNTKPSLVVSVVSGQVGLGFQPVIHPPGEDRTRAWQLVIDLPSLIKLHPGHEKAEPLPDGQVLWTSTSAEGDQVAAWFGRRSPHSINRLEISTIRHDVPPRLILDTIHLNDEVTYQIRPLPKTDSLSHVFKVAQAPLDPARPEEMAHQLNALFATLMRTMQLRQAIRLPRLRPAFEKTYQIQTIDWTQLANRNALDSAYLRQFVHLPGPGRAIH